MGPNGTGQLVRLNRGIDDLRPSLMPSVLRKAERHEIGGSSRLPSCAGVHISRRGSHPGWRYQLLHPTKKDWPRPPPQRRTRDPQNIPCKCENRDRQRTSHPRRQPQDPWVQPSRGASVSARGRDYLGQNPLPPCFSSVRVRLGHLAFLQIRVDG